MPIKDHIFTISKGRKLEAGKSQYPALMRLVVPKEQAIELAMKILQGYEMAKPDDSHLLEIPLFGELEDLEDE